METEGIPTKPKDSAQSITPRGQFSVLLDGLNERRATCSLCKMLFS